MKNSLDSLSAGRKTELFGWLTEEGRFAPDISVAFLKCSARSSLRWAFR